MKSCLGLVCMGMWANGVISLLAQEATPIPPPKFPLSLRAPEKAAWTVTYKGGNAPTEESKRPFVRQLTVTKSGPIYLETATVANGQSWERWVIRVKSDTFCFVRYTGEQKWIPVEDSINGNYLKYDRSDFEDLQWATEETYKGVQSVEKIPAYFFEKTSNTPFNRLDIRNYDIGAHIEPDAPKEYFAARMWLDVKTLLPIKYDNGKIVAAYAYVEPSRLTLPTEVIAGLKKWFAQIKERSK